MLGYSVMSYYIGVTKDMIMLVHHDSPIGGHMKVARHCGLLETVDYLCETSHSLYKCYHTDGR